MRYLAIDRFSTANGIGVRTVLWLSGCSHRCKGCHNPESWDKNGGTLFTKDTLYELNALLGDPYIRGLTLSGGDPFEEYNIPEIVFSMKYLKNHNPKKDIWAYTGYWYEDLLKNEHPLLDYVDVLVDGPFDITKRDITLPFKGSTNQRIINVKKSLEKEKVVLWEQ